MIEGLIEWSARNKFLVFIFTLFAVAGGLYALQRTPLDAIPDLSDVQVIVYTDWEGRSPDLVEDQITYPISTKFIAAPKVKFVRGESMFGKSFVYVIFEDGTDIYWARSRVIEYLNGVRGSLPEGVNPVIGPDATGVGWVFEYALVDDTGKHDLAQLRSFQDWNLRYALESVKGVSEVASVGGFVKQYQIDLDPNKLAAYHLPLSAVVEAVKKSNADVGGKIFEVASTEYFVRGRGYIKSVADIENIPLKVENGTPVYVKNVGAVHLGSDLRRGVAELDGRGETVGGIVVMRYGENALTVIDGIKKKLAEIQSSLPAGVRVVPTYDRSGLIKRSIDTLREKLIEESIVVALVCLVFLWHVRSALVAIITLPIAILLSFLPMLWLGLTSNIMSLGGIAIAIGAMVDAAIIMVENAHKALEHFREKEGREPDNAERVDGDHRRGQNRGQAAVFFAAGHHGELHPRVLAHGAGGAAVQAAGLHEDVFDVLRGTARRDPRARADDSAHPGQDHPGNQEPGQPPAHLDLSAARQFRAALPLVDAADRTHPPWRHRHSLSPSRQRIHAAAQRRHPPLHAHRRARHGRGRGDPDSANPGPAAYARIPEVERVFGKAGQSETSTDPAPLSMFETVVSLKPPEQWRPGMTWDKIVAEMNANIKTPGMANIFWMPIQTRTEMLTTGFRSVLGIKVFGPDLAGIQDVAVQIEKALTAFPNTRSVFAERTTGGYFLDFTVNREAAARYGLGVGDVNDVIESAIGGKTITTTVEGRERYPVNVRYARDFREDLDALKRVLVSTPTGAQVPISMLADIQYKTGPPSIRDENGQLVGFVFIDLTTSDIEGYVRAASEKIKQTVSFPAGYYTQWAGQFEYLKAAEARLKVVIPFTLLIIFVLIYMNTQSVAKTAIVLLAVPFSLIGAFWLLYLLGYNMSVAVWVGLIALAGLDAETGVVMLLYLDHAWEEHRARGQMNSMEDFMPPSKRARCSGFVPRS